MRSVRSLVVEPLFHKPIWPLFNVIVTDTYDCYVLCDLMWTKEKVAPNCTHKITAGFSSFSLLLLIIYCFRFFPLLLKCNSPSFISFFPGCSFIYSHLIRLIKKQRPLDFHHLLLSVWNKNCSWNLFAKVWKVILCADAFAIYSLYKNW